MASSSSTSVSSSASVSTSMTATSSSENISKESHDTDDEIPVWIRGEQRWISGITKQTTCAQLVDALLRDEAATGNVAATTTASTTTLMPSRSGLENQYVITERWRRVEQILESKTKILKIWRAWGETKSEVSIYLVGK